jgi:hypothetical protein
MILDIDDIEEPTQFEPCIVLVLMGSFFIVFYSLLLDKMGPEL